MLDVDGVLVTGRPSDGLAWNTDLQDDMGIDPVWLGQTFFARYWTDIVEGRLDLEPTLEICLKQDNINANVKDLIDYWFAMDSEPRRVCRRL